VALLAQFAFVSLQNKNIMDAFDIEPEYMEAARNLTVQAGDDDTSIAAAREVRNWRDGRQPPQPPQLDPEGTAAVAAAVAAAIGAAVPRAVEAAVAQPVTMNVAQQQLQDRNDRLRTKTNELLTAANARKHRRAAKTINQHDNENIRFVLWLYDQEHYAVISGALVLQLDTIAAECQIDATLADAEKAKQQKLRAKMLRQAVVPYIADATYLVDSPCLVFDELTADIYLSYLLKHRNAKGGPLAAKVYSNKRSSLTWFFKKHKRVPTIQFTEAISEGLQGIKRVISKATTDGVGEVEGKREMSFELYRKVNRWSVEKGERRYIWFRAYLTLTWNLMCRGESTYGVCIKHLVWRQDACGISFSHQKNDQEGSRNFKPRHVYCNPTDPLVCCVTAIGEYLVTFPEILADLDGRLFPGGDSQEKTFGEILTALLTEHEEELMQLGYNLDDIGTHSIRKGATTYATSGTTAAPSSAAVNVRGGWTLGGQRDVYMLYERAGDEYVGRVLSGLDIMSASFGSNNPDFYPILNDSTNETFTDEQRNELERRVNEGIVAVFGGGHHGAIYLFLRIALASILHHKDALSTIYPPRNQMAHTMIFRDERLQELGHHVVVRYPLMESGIEVIRLTGVPPTSKYYQN
jgi:hypothetical protein